MCVCVCVWPGLCLCKSGSTAAAWVLSPAARHADLRPVARVRARGRGPRGSLGQRRIMVGQSISRGYVGGRRPITAVLWAQGKGAVGTAVRSCAALLGACKCSELRIDPCARRVQAPVVLAGDATKHGQRDGDQAPDDDDDDDGAKGEGGGRLRQAGRRTGRQAGRNEAHVAHM